MDIIPGWIFDSLGKNFSYSHKDLFMFTLLYFLFKETILYGGWLKHDLVNKRNTPSTSVVWNVID